jgi:hypothetical protein
MLHDFIVTNRTLLIDRCRVMVAGRSSAKQARPELAHGIPIFLDEVANTLAIEQRSSVVENKIASSNPGGRESGVRVIATLHGRDLFEQGFAVEQVIRDYRDVCPSGHGSRRGARGADLGQRVSHV